MSITIRFNADTPTSLGVFASGAQTSGLPDAEAIVFLGAGRAARIDAQVVNPPHYELPGTASVPAGGWPASQLDAAVQASLAKADRMGALPLGPILLLAKDNAQASRASANAGADNVYQVMKSFLLPGGSMGRNGTLHWDLEASLTSSASTKEFALRIGGVLISPAWSLTTSATEQRSGKLHANNSQAAQKFRATTAIQGGSAQGYTTTAIDLTVDQTVELVCRWGAASVAGETIAIEVFRAAVEYGA